MEIPQYTKSVLLQDNVKNILKKARPVRKGIDIKLYQFGDSSKKDVQTVVTFLASKYNTEEYSRDNNDIDKVLSEALDKVLISDRVKSASDFYKINNKKDLDSNKKMSVWGSL